MSLMVWVGYVLSLNFCMHAFVPTMCFDLLTLTFIF